jgi:hypothetical protein
VKGLDPALIVDELKIVRRLTVDDVYRDGFLPKEPIRP